MTFLFLLAKVYLDYAATTPCDPRVVKAMNDVYARNLGNPNADHEKGREAKLEILKAAETIKNAVNGDHIIWTSGATEANNIAILCSSLSGTVITCATEHKSVLEPVSALSSPRKRGSRDTAQAQHDNIILEVNNGGHIDLNELKKHIKSARLVSLMMVNNETGVQHPIHEIGQLCHKRGVLFHVDAAQAFGKMKIDMKRDHIDMLTVSGHKIYGPQGIGALVLSDKGLKALQVGLPLSYGGAPQYGIRPGTVPTVLCVGLAKACELAHKEMEANYQNACKQKSEFWKQIKTRYPKAQINGKTTWPNILSIRIPRNGKDNPILKLSKDYTFSSGSACSAGKLSHVMQAMGIDTKNAHILRFSFDRN